MDRRRYVPSPEGLEVRTMLSTSTAGSPLAFLGGSSTTTQTLPITFQQKSQRIQKIPENLRALEPNRYLPQGRDRADPARDVPGHGPDDPAPEDSPDQLQPGAAQNCLQFVAQPRRMRSS